MSKKTTSAAAVLAAVCVTGATACTWTGGIYQGAGLSPALIPIKAGQCDNAAYWNKYGVPSAAFKNDYGSEVTYALPGGLTEVYASGDVLCWCKPEKPKIPLWQFAPDFTGIKTTGNGVVAIRFKNIGNGGVQVDTVSTETSPYWRWKTGDPFIECPLDTTYPDPKDEDPCNPKPTCTTSGLGRPDIDLDSSYYQQLATDLGNDNIAISEYETEKPAWNVWSVVIDDANAASSIMTTYYPAEGALGGDVKSQCSAVRSTATLVREITHSDDEGNQLTTKVLNIFQSSVDPSSAAFDFEEHAEDIVTVSVTTDSAGNIVSLGEGLQPVNSADLDSEVKSILEKVDAAPFNSGLCDDYTLPQAGPIASVLGGAHAELQGKKTPQLVKKEDGQYYWDEEPDKEAKPTHPGPGNWFPTSINAFDGVYVKDLNCKSDIGILGTLSQAAIYTHNPDRKGKRYIYNDFHTWETIQREHPNGVGYIAPNIPWYNRFNFGINSKNADALGLKNKITVCPGTKMQMDCSSVHFTAYGPKDVDQREIMCVKNTVNGDMAKLLNDFKIKYARCPDKNPYKNIPAPVPFTEAFIIVSGSIDGLWGNDFWGEGGNLEAKLGEFAWAETPYHHNDGHPTPNCRSHTSDRYDWWDHHGSLLDRNELSFPNENPSLVTLPASCNIGQTTISRVHEGVKQECQIHRDRAFGVGLEKMYINPNTGKPYDRITYMGHSRGAAKATYLATRHRNLYPDQDLRLVASGAMGVFEGRYYEWNGSDWVISKSKNTGSHGQVFESIPKFFPLNKHRACKNGKATHDGAFSSFKNLKWYNVNEKYNSRQCEKKWFGAKAHKQKKKDTVYKLWFNTDDISDSKGSLPGYHAYYANFAYYSRPTDSLWY